MAGEYTVAQGKPGVARVIQIDPELAADAPALLEMLHKICSRAEPAWVDSRGWPMEKVRSLFLEQARELLGKHGGKL